MKKFTEVRSAVGQLHTLHASQSDSFQHYRYTLHATCYMLHATCYMLHHYRLENTVIGDKLHNIYIKATYIYLLLVAVYNPVLIRINLCKLLTYTH